MACRGSGRSSAALPRSAGRRRRAPAATRPRARRCTGGRASPARSRARGRRAGLLPTPRPARLKPSSWRRTAARPASPFAPLVALAAAGLAELVPAEQKAHELSPAPRPASRARRVSRVWRWMRASRRRSHHSSAAGAVKPPRIAGLRPPAAAAPVRSAPAIEAERRASAAAVTGPSSSSRLRRIRAARRPAPADPPTPRAIGGATRHPGTAPGTRAGARQRSHDPRHAGRRHVEPGQAALICERAGMVFGRRARDFLPRQEAVHDQRIVQLVGVARSRARLRRTPARSPRDRAGRGRPPSAGPASCRVRTARVRRSSAGASSRKA